jgi:hypothetical protein
MGKQPLSIFALKRNKKYGSSEKKNTEAKTKGKEKFGSGKKEANRKIPKRKAK